MGGIELSSLDTFVLQDVRRPVDSRQGLMTTAPTFIRSTTRLEDSNSRGALIRLSTPTVGVGVSLGKLSDLRARRILKPSLTPMGVLVWLESNPLSVWVHESPSVWAQPTVLTLHTMGMAVLVGASWILDLRLLGISRNIPLSAFRWVFRAVAVGLIVNVLTGVLVFTPAATTW